MAKVDAFLDALINYDKENIHPEIIKSIQPYLKDEEFEPEFVRSKSAAAAGIFSKDSISTKVLIRSILIITKLFFLIFKQVYVLGS